MRLKYVQQVDFRKSELTNYNDLVKRFHWKLSGDQVGLLISKRGNQLIFVHGVDATDGGRAVLRSERMRLFHGSWNPRMLGNYAKELGINFVGVKLFEHYYPKLNTQDRRR